MITIAVTGYKGRVGSELVRMGCVPLDCDITDYESVEAAIHGTKPDVVINCAAYTNVDGAETEYEKSLKINTWAIEKIRNAFDGRLIHISTDYIWKGMAGPYDEKNFDFDPVNNYGFSKVGGEVILNTHNKQNSIIVRTTGLFGGCSGKHDFVKLVIDHLKQEKVLHVTKALKGNQTYVPYLAEALLKVATTEKMPKILHIASKDVISRYDFAVMIANVFGYNSNYLVPVDNRDVTGWVARRPRKGGLKTRLAEKVGLPIYTVLDGLKAYRDEKC